MTDRPLAVLGVPSSAGSHHAGIDLAPAALRAAGLLEVLRAAGLEVRDAGDLPAARHVATPRVDGVRALEATVAVVAAVRRAVSGLLDEEVLPLVLGGDCTVTLGVVAGLAERTDAGLLYVDGDADLNLPESSGSGVLDTMGMTHLLGGGAPALAGVGPRHPLLPPDHVELLGFDPGELDTGQWERLTAHGLAATTAPQVRADPAGTAHRALTRLESRCASFVLHLDVDVLDTGAFPLAAYPHFAGLSLGQLREALAAPAASDRLGAVVVTEVAPDHDTGGAMVRQLVELLADVLGKPRTGPGGGHGREAVSSRTSA